MSLICVLVLMGCGDNVTCFWRWSRNFFAGCEARIDEGFWSPLELLLQVSMGVVGICESAVRGRGELAWVASEEGERCSSLWVDIALIEGGWVGLEVMVVGASNLAGARG